MERNTSVTNVEHRPVYGSNEVDEIICSCDWRGRAFDLPDHYERVGREAAGILAQFVSFMEDECVGDDWSALDSLDDRAGFLTPIQLLIAMRNRTFFKNEATERRPA